MTQAPDLPLSFRGYDRDTIDSFLEQVEDAYQWLAAERDGLRDQVERLERELRRYRAREEQITEFAARAEEEAAALKAEAAREIEEQRGVLAQDKLAAESERDAILRQAELSRADSQAEADALLRQARMEADALRHEAQLSAERLTLELTARATAQQQAAERVLDDTRARLAAMVTDLIRQLPVGSAGSFGPRPPA